MDVDDGPPARRRRTDQSQLDQPPSLGFLHQHAKEKRKTELWTAQSMNFSGDGLVVIDGGRASGKWQGSGPETLVIDWNCRSDPSSLRKHFFQLARTTNSWVQLGVD